MGLLRMMSPAGVTTRALAENSTSKLQDTDDSRELKAECHPQLMRILTPVTIQNYQRCIAESEAGFDMNLPSADVSVQAACWCKHDVKRAINDYGCCDHPEFKLLCQLSCNPQCSSPSAQRCLRECPSLCLEPDYAPMGCNERCMALNCGEYILCITDQLGTHPEISSGCDGRAFSEAPQISDYYSCMQKQPLKTYWHHWNAQRHCSCNASLDQLARFTSCCGTDWAETICTGSCKPEDNCSSPAGQRCLQDCQQNCATSYPVQVNDNCKNLCVADGGACASYSSCEPVTQSTFDYVCDDGSQPASNGCCQEALADGGGAQKENCPALCESGRRHHLPQGVRCQCFQCPTTQEVAREAMSQLYEGLWDNGQNALIDIAREFDLELGPTRRMQEMMRDRNRELMEAFKQHAHTNLQSQASQISATWLASIEAEARRFKEGVHEPPTDAFGTPSMSSLSGHRHKEENRGMQLAMFFVLGLCAGLFLIFGVLVLVYDIRRKQALRRQAAGHPIRADDPNVVVGRPVTNGNELQTMAGALAILGGGSDCPIRGSGCTSSSSGSGGTKADLTEPGKLTNILPGDEVQVAWAE